MTEKPILEVGQSEFTTSGTDLEFEAKKQQAR